MRFIRAPCPFSKCTPHLVANYRNGSGIWSPIVELYPKFGPQRLKENYAVYKSPVPIFEMYATFGLQLSGLQRNLVPNFRVARQVWSPMLEGKLCGL